jgi:hypothetical protein
LREEGDRCNSDEFEAGSVAIDGVGSKGVESKGVESGAG